MLKLKRRWVILGSILFFISGTIYVTDALKSYNIIVLIVGGIMVGLCGKPPNRISFMSILNPYNLFVITLILSYIVNDQASILLTIAGMMFIRIACNTSFPTAYNKCGMGEKEIHDLLLVSMLVVFIISLASGGFRTSRYEGIFSNPNACGGAAATMCAISCSCFMSNVISDEKQSRRRVILSLICLGLGVFMALISTSRTSVVTIGILFFAMTVLLLRRGSTRKNTGKVLAIIFALVIVGFILYRFTPLHSYMGSVLDKFTAKEDDTLSGRGKNWEAILENAKWFGNGENIRMAAHNTYLSLLGQYGILSGVLWALYVLIGLIRSVIWAWSKEEHIMKFLPVFSYVCFVSTSLTEGMMLKTIMLLCVFSEAVMDNKYRPPTGELTEMKIMDNSIR